MKRFILGILCMNMVCLMTGCAVEKTSTEKLRDMEFTVIPGKDIPEELAQMVDEKEGEAFKLTFADEGALYIAVGYGKQPTSGYSIEVAALYETRNAIYIRTNLLGPSKEEKILERATYPYITVKTEFVDKNVVFE